MMCRNVCENGLDSRICALLMLIKANIHFFFFFLNVFGKISPYLMIFLLVLNSVLSVVIMKRFMVESMH